MFVCALLLSINLNIEFCQFSVEIPNLQDILNRTNRRINRELNRDHINEAKGVLSFIQSIQLHSDEKMVRDRISDISLTNVF